MNNTTQKYKGYIGSMEISLDDNCLYGKILFIKDIISYEAENPQALEVEFQDAVDDYLETCAELGIEPKQPYTGSFNVRVGPDAHEQLAVLSVTTGRSMNGLVKQAVLDLLQNRETKEIHHHHKTVEFRHRFETQPQTGVPGDEQFSVDTFLLRTSQTSQH